MICFIFLGIIAAVGWVMFDDIGSVSLICYIMFLVCNFGACIFYEKLKDRIRKLEERNNKNDE